MLLMENNQAIEAGVIFLINFAFVRISNEAQITDETRNDIPKYFKSLKYS